MPLGSTLVGIPSNPSQKPARPALITMNSGTTELPAVAELETLKRELMKAEVRLAKARATVVGAEIDIKVLSTRLKAAAK